MRAREISLSTFLTRKEGTTDEVGKPFGCYQQALPDLDRENSVSDRSQGIVNNIYEGVIDASSNTCCKPKIVFLEKRL